MEVESEQICPMPNRYFSDLPKCFDVHGLVKLRLALETYFDESPIYGGVANKETVNYPDIQALERLRMLITARTFVKIKNLQLEPRSIPGTKIFTTNIPDLVSKDGLVLPSGVGLWKKHGRELGWGVKGLDGKFMGIKRTFVFHIRGNDNYIKTNWIMNLYARIDNGDRIINTTKYLCHVFQHPNYDPRPLHNRLLVDMAVDPAKAEAEMREYEKVLMREYEKVLMSDTSTGGENWDPNAAGPSMGIASGKKRKTTTSSTSSRFTEVSGSGGTKGEVLKLSICNHCGAVYRTSSGKGTLGRHKCRDD